MSPVKVEPDSARVNIQVFKDQRSRSVVVNPIVTGTPAAGFELATITVVPPSVTVQGDAERLATLESIDTQPVSVSGASSTVETTVELDPPDGVSPLSVTTVNVTVTFRPVTSTRNFEVGYRLVGADIDLRYSVPVDRVRDRRSAARRPTSTSWTARPSSRTSTSATSTRARRTWT